MRKTGILALLTACSSLCAQVELLKDIYSQPTNGIPQEMTVYEDYMFFRGIDKEHGGELWITDGTVQGTNFFIELQTGATGSGPTCFTELAGSFYFTMRDYNSTRIYKSDGTLDNTSQLVKIEGSTYNMTVLAGVVNNKIIYSVDQTGYGKELYVTDGTVAGSKLLKDINPGTSSSNCSGFTILNNVIYFRASDGTHGTELWRTDGTTSGTYMVKDINPSGNGYPVYMAAGTSILYFIANDGVNGTELWKSDGTSGGTRMVKDLNPSGNSNIDMLLTLGDTVYFKHSDATRGTELWKSDGTAGGTTVAMDYVPGTEGLNPTLINKTDNKIFLYATGGYLYATDGTMPGTEIIAEKVGTWNPYFDDPTGFTTDGTNAYISIRKSEPVGRSIYKSDGTAAGTTELYFNPDHSIKHYWFRVFKNHLYFRNTDAVNGEELWRADIHSGGAALFYDTYPGNGDSKPRGFTKAGDKIFFRANAPDTGEEPWVYDLLSDSTYLPTDLAFGGIGSYPDYFAEFNNKVYFRAQTSGVGNELFYSDGTAANTDTLVDLCPGSCNSYPTPHLPVNGKLVFHAQTSMYGGELYTTDGTIENTRLLKDINPGAGYATPSNFTKFNNKLAFIANNGSITNSFWITDGTSDGTIEINNLGVNQGAYLFQPFDSILYFSFNDGAEGHELYRTNGTLSGTYKAVDMSTSGTAKIKKIGRLYDKMYVLKSDGLYCTDGTQEGTTELDIDPYFPHIVSNFFQLRNKLILLAGNYGNYKIYSITYNDSAISHFPIPDDNIYPIETILETRGDYIYFTRDDGMHGSELWRTDGTPENTEMVEDILGGEESSTIVQFEAFDTLALFSANSVAYGREPFKYTFEPDIKVFNKQEYISGDTIILEEQYVGDSTEKVFYLTNTGSGTIELNGDPAIALSGNDAAYFTINQPMKNSIAFHDTTTLSVSLNTMLEGEYFTELIISSNDDNEPDFSLYLKGTAEKIPQTIDFKSIEDKTYGDDDFNLEVTASSGLPVSLTTYPDTIISLSGSTATIENSGTVEITANQSGNEFFLPASVSQMVTINKLDLNVSVKDTTKHYSQPNPDFEFLYDSFAYDDSETDLDTLPDITCSANKNSWIGQYDVVPSNGNDNNYNYTFSNGKLTITKIPVAITISDLQQLYDGTEKQVTITTIPDSVDVITTYDGTSSLPEKIGKYFVEVTMPDTIYEGYGSDTLEIAMKFTGIKDESVSFRVYPNPVHEMLTIHSYNNGIEGDLHFSIFSINGHKQMQKRILSEKTVINLSEYKAGTYVLMISGKSQQKSFIILKE